MAEGNDKHVAEEIKEEDNETSREYVSKASQSTSEWLASLMGQTLSISEDSVPPVQLLDEVTFEGVAKYIRSGQCKKIVVMAGAGISTSAGIPDFRSPGTGLYDNLQKYNLPEPTAIFNINFFEKNPEPFFLLAKELWPGIFKPTPSHYFVRLLAEKGLLCRHFTQNIDSLERTAGVEEAKLTEAHGTFHTSHCLRCRKEFSQDWIKEKIFGEGIPHCSDAKCGGLVKPDIVFFGEALPKTYFQAVNEDIPQCDMLIIMGTSLVVQPFASLTNQVPKTTPRLYINMEKTEETSDPWMQLLGMGNSFKFDDDDNYRDVFWQGTCDDGCYKLSELLGWEDELKKLVQSEHAKIEAKNVPLRSTGVKQAKEETSPAGGATKG
ncbi:NAD-dependent protein deacetylase sirtuin-2 [Lamellibrachia satsuma]|nr:NAD-dependent protein deacetylase sirtuin-2 [Lamellibrachia satsuma]